ncbi:MAG: hydroxymethylbilane synthase [Myxococcales bacterium]|nr:hydroxymethylbilane synthase [Myxococcales bacterium]
MKLRIATRQSPLALAQTRWVGKLLAAHHPRLIIEEVPMTTRGDTHQGEPLWQMGGKALFVSELEHAILEGSADLAVHSMKDLPAQLADGLEIACVPSREDPRDALIAQGGEALDDLEAGARVGTSSLRRVSQLRRLRPDLAYVAIRGNVDTRLRKLDRGEFAAIVLAVAGLRRLGIHDPRIKPIARELSIPAIGQGALALEAKCDDVEVLSCLASLEDPMARTEIEAERAFAKRLGIDCHTPVAAHAASFANCQQLRLDAMVASEVQNRVVTASTSEQLNAASLYERHNQARRMGNELAEQMLREGAAEMIALG